MKVPKRKGSKTRYWSIPSDKEIQEIKENDIVLYYPTAWTFLKCIGKIIEIRKERIYVLDIDGPWKNLVGVINDGNIVKNVSKDYPEYCI